MVWAVSFCAEVVTCASRAYGETNESDPPEIQLGIMELEEFLKTLPLDGNNAVINLTYGVSLLAPITEQMFFESCREGKYIFM